MKSFDFFGVVELLFCVASFTKVLNAQSLNTDQAKQNLIVVGAGHPDRADPSGHGNLGLAVTNASINSTIVSVDAPVPILNSTPPQEAQSKKESRFINVPMGTEQQNTTRPNVEVHAETPIFRTESLNNTVQASANTQNQQTPKENEVNATFSRGLPKETTALSFGTSGNSTLGPDLSRITPVSTNMASPSQLSTGPKDVPVLKQIFSDSSTVSTVAAPSGFIQQLFVNGPIAPPIDDKMGPNMSKFEPPLQSEDGRLIHLKSNVILAEDSVQILSVPLGPDFNKKGKVPVETVVIHPPKLAAPGAVDGSVKSGEQNGPKSFLRVISPPLTKEDLNAPLFPPVQPGPVRLLGDFTTAFIAARSSFFEVMKKPFASVSNFFNPSSASSTEDPSGSTSKSSGGGRQRRSLLEDDDPFFTKLNKDHVECGAYLAEMSTSKCTRFEKYKLRSCSNDNDACLSLAQEDLIGLLVLCSETSEDTVCKMTTRIESTVSCNLYEFSIGRMVGHNVENCFAQIASLNDLILSL